MTGRLVSGMSGALITSLATQVYGSGVALALVACVPDWPFYNKQQLRWLSPDSTGPALALPASKQRKLR